MNHKKYLSFILISLLTCLSLTVNADEPKSKAVTQEKQSTLTPQRALELLKEGNQRFVNGKMRDYHFTKEMITTSTNGQFPIATIVSCIDSRSIPDFLFDQGLGNLFVARMAGNVIDKDLLGSMEFANGLSGARLIVVMGHTHCGAVVGACASLSTPTGIKNLDFLLDKIKPAVSEIKKNDKELSCQNPETIDKITRQNIINQLHYIHENSSMLSDLIKEKSIYLVGAMNNITTGEVDFFGEDGKPM